MREIIIKALAERIKVSMMTIEEVPEVYKEEVQKFLDNATPLDPVGL